MKMVTEEDETRKNLGRNNHELPEGWIVAPLEELCDIYDSERIPVNLRNRENRVTGRKQNELYPYYGATGQVGWIDDYIFDGEFVLLGEDGAPFLDFSKGTAYIVQGKFWVNNHAHILICHPSNKYLCFYLNQIDFREFVTGTTRLKLNQSRMKKIPVPVSPEREQLRIVSKLEESLSELDKGIESFKTARDQLTVYRQAVLKHAFEGKLTEEWRKKHTDELVEPAETLLEKIKAEREQRYRQQLDDWKRAVKTWEASGKEGKKPTKPGTPKELPPLTEKELSELPELPKGWEWIRLGTVIDEPKYGTSKKCSYKSSGVGVLRIPNIVGGSINAEDLKYAIFDDDEKDAYSLEEGDLLVIRSNGSVSLVGQTALVKDNDTEYLYAGYLIRIRSNKNVLDNKYLNFLFTAHILRSQIESKAKSTSGVNNINSRELQSLTNPVCSLIEQQEIVLQIESRLSVAEKLEQEIEEGLKQSEALRQSLLKKAFEGRLVPQDSNDESASVLLERIKTEKAKLKQKARKEKTVAV